ncbi:hypothetical protein BKA66DRAFT_577366 [Pyrenochaeta sp. MPI-SDFR-AT-0127]|nr:hypothetical protein BKA66DRAFT_577366 [Pyrenochaeta sp. MPI-SDFR-AT-0127]
MKKAQQAYSEQPSLPSSPTSSVKSSLDSVSDIASDILTEPTFESEWSTKARTADTPLIEGLKFKYHSVVWSQLPGFSIPISRRTARLNSPIWKFGVPIEHTETGARWWLCVRCHTSDPISRTCHAHYYKVDGGSTNVVEHIRQVYGKTWNKEREIIPFKRRGILVPAALDTNESREQEILNALALAFDETTF